MTSSFELLKDQLNDPDLPKRMTGVLVGTVTDNIDPLGLGRVLVRLPDIDSLDTLSWARVAVPLTGPSGAPPHGTYFIPQIGCEVLVAFERGDLERPYVVGCLWNNLARPPLYEPMQPGPVSVIRTLAGNQIVLTDVPPSIVIQSGPTSPVPIPTPATPTTPPHTITVGPDGITVTSPARITFAVGASSITLTPDGMTILAPKVSLVGAAEVAITATLVRIN